MQELPFQFGDPVVKPLFYDREELLQELYLCLTSLKKGTHQDVALIAPRRIGKSSILKTVQQRLEKEGLVIVHVDLSRIPPTEKIDFFFVEYLRKVFSAYNKAAGWRLLDDRITQIVEGIPERVKEILSSLQLGAEINETLTVWLRFQQGVEKNKKSAWEKSLELPELLAKKTGIPCVVFWDEFQEIHRFDGDLLWYIRSIIQHHQHVAYAITGSSIRWMSQIVSGKRSAFYGHFLIRSVGAFEDKVARKFLQERIRSVGMKFTDEAVDLILSKTNSIPFYLQWLGLHCYLLASISKAKEIDEQLVEEAYKRGLSHLPQLEEDLEKVGGRAREVLVTMALHPEFSVHQIAKHLGVRDGGASREIRKLVTFEMIKKLDRGKYSFQDLVFQDWIVHRYSI